MKIKGEYRQKYTADREAKELVVEVDLKQHDGLGEAGRNIWYGVATANDKVIKLKPYSLNPGVFFLSD